MPDLHQHPTEHPLVHEDHHLRSCATLSSLYVASPGLDQAVCLQLWRPQWYQFVTSAFFHISFSHISNNIFFLYIFGRIGEPCLIAELWSFADLVSSASVVCLNHF